jgi:hypothetical protein
MSKPKISNDGRTITVRNLILIRKRGGRKLILAPDGTTTVSHKLSDRHFDDAMVKALARAFRWREMLEIGKYSTIKEMARSENINPSYVARVLRLTLLAPDLVEEIVHGRPPSAVSLPLMLKPFPSIWKNQHATFGLIA